MAQSGANSGDSPSGSSAASSAAAFLDEAREKIKANDAPGALICLRAVAGLAGCPPELMIEACKLLAQAGDNEAALSCYLSAGTTYLREQKDLQKARQALQAGHALDVHNLDIIFMLGQTDVADGRLQDGLAKFIDILRKSNLKHVPALFEAGCIYQINGQFDQAMLAFKKVLDRDKNHVQASVRIGQLYQSKENLTEAVGYYIQGAQIARECQHWGTARQIAQTVLAIDPQNQKARVLLADLDEQGLGMDAPPAIEPIHLKAPVQAPGKSAPGLGQVKTQTRMSAPAGKAPAPASPPPAATPPAAEPAQAKSAPTQPAQPAAKAPLKSEPAQAAPAARPQPPLVAQVAAKTSPQPPPLPEPAAAPQKPPAPPVSAAPASAPAPDDIERARQMLGAIEAQRQAAQQDLQLLLSTRDELQKALAEQRTILEAATMRKKDLDERLATAEREVAERAPNAPDPSVEREALASIAADRASLEAAVADLRVQNQALASRKAEDEAAVKELTALRDKLTAEVGALTTKMQDAKRLTDELEAMHASTPAPDPQEVAKAQALLDDLNALAAKKADHEAKIAATQASLEQLTGRVEATQRQAQEAEAARAARQAEADALMQRVVGLTATLKDLEQRSSGGASSVPAPAAQPNVGPQGAHAHAAAHLAAGEFDKAIEAYRQALEANPQDGAAAYQAGALMAEHGGDLDTAERLLTQAAELRPDHAATRYQLAVVKARRGAVVEGAELLSALARTDANNGDFVDQFVERLEKDAQGGDLGAKYRVGVAYRELGRVEEALVTLQSIQHEPEFVVPCLIAIGLCLRRQGLDGAAAKRFAKAIETPGYPESLYLEALYNLGDLYEAKGTQESLALALASFEELYAREVTYRDVGERVRVVKTNLGSAERQKVKRLPTRIADSQGNQ